ncbi:hypothetical protein AM587_10012521 [Phytophthora nicotianae]|uniref:Uncharacterized protein n=1 Tax=Phytophthora nicotianae TaxID=4792 RepID=A0A0W8D1K7_PHYNI|nr:hypothetical protein AM587_10012521 [Phytophthora nicotianae]
MNEVFDAETVQQNSKQSRSPTQAVHRETQSLRELGDDVDWERQQIANVTKAETCFRESLAGVRYELQRRGLSEGERLSLTTELLEKTKHGYARHIQALVVEELAREMDREVAMRLELARLGRERMQRQHDKEREFYRAQIARIREECEMALTAAAAKNNLLR